MYLTDDRAKKEVSYLTLNERITEALRGMPEQAQRQVLDFTLFLKQREQKALAADVDALIDENLDALTELAK